MIPTNNVGAKDGAGGTQEVQKPDQIGRPIERTTRDDGRGKRFKEVLGKEDEKKEKAKLIASDDDEEESLSPMSLITSVTKKREKSGDEASADSSETPPDEVAVVVTPDSHDKGIPTKKLTTEKIVVPGDNTKTSAPLASFVEPRNIVARNDEKEVVKQPIFQTPIAVATTTHTTTKPVLPDDDKEVLVTPPIPEKKSSDDTGKQKGGDVLGQATLGVAVPVAQPIEASIVTDVKKVPQETAKVRETLVKLAEEMIARLSVVTTVDRTDTTITLRYPPLFAGAQVMITEYKSAQNQFNVTFSGLHPEALQMIAMKNNQEELRQNLIDKGYMLQMVTIEQKIPGLESTKTETLFTGLKQDERAENQGDATEEDK